MIQIEDLQQSALECAELARLLASALDTVGPDSGGIDLAACARAIARQADRLVLDLDADSVRRVAHAT